MQGGVWWDGRRRRSRVVLAAPARDLDPPPWLEGGDRMADLVLALAAPIAEKVQVWRADLVALLAAVDRLVQAPGWSR